MNSVFATKMFLVPAGSDSTLTSLFFPLKADIGHRHEWFSPEKKKTSGQISFNRPLARSVDSWPLKRWRENSPFKTELEILMPFQRSFSVYPAQCGKMSTWNSNKAYINLLNGEQFKWNRNFLCKPFFEDLWINYWWVERLILPNTGATLSLHFLLKV